MDPVAAQTAARLRAAQSASDLQGLRTLAAQGNSPEAIREIAEEFEALFVGIMLDSMRSTRQPEQNLLYGGMAEDMFDEMLFDEYARQIAQSGDLGIADMLVSELSRAAGVYESAQSGERNSAGLNLEG